MSILVITDLHSQQKILRPLEQTIARLQPEAIFCLGDLTVYGPSAGLYTDEFLLACGHPRRSVLVVSGNNDDPMCLAKLEAENCLLDYKEADVAGTRVVGLGYEPADEPFHPNLEGAVLLSHLPPKQQSLPPGFTGGPKFHFAGHIHSAQKIWQLGATTVVQVPSAMSMRAAILDMDSNQVEFISLV